MPSKSSNVYSLSYHPAMDEWVESKKQFLDNFKKLYGKDKYIIVPEKGKNNVYTHW